MKRNNSGNVDIFRVKKIYESVDKTKDMKKSINLKDLFLLVPFLLIPIFGSLALGFILSVAICLSFYFIIKGLFYLESSFANSRYANICFQY